MPSIGKRSRKIKNETENENENENDRMRLDTLFRLSFVAFFPFLFIAIVWHIMSLWAC